MAKLVFVALFCTLLAICIVPPANADTTYTYTGPQFNEFGAAVCPPTCNFSGSFTVPTPVPTNANVAIDPSATFAFSVAPFTFTNLTDGQFLVSTNAAGAIDSWSIVLVESIGNGEFAYIFSSPGEDQLDFAGPDGYDGGLKPFFGADNIGGPTTPGVWTASTSAGVPEPSTFTLLIAGMIGLLSLGLRKHA
jgi:hypothetical protein